MAEIFTTSTSGRRDEERALAPGTARAVLVGTLIGFVVVGGFCAGVAALVGFGVGASVALGAFTGFWGGPGFGGMMGFVLNESASHDRETATNRHHARR